MHECPKCKHKFLLVSDEPTVVECRCGNKLKLITLTPAGETSEAKPL